MAATAHPHPQSAVPQRRFPLPEDAERRYAESVLARSVDKQAGQFARPVRHFAVWFLSKSGVAERVDPLGRRQSLQEVLAMVDAALNTYYMAYPDRATAIRRFVARFSLEARMLIGAMLLDVEYC